MQHFGFYYKKTLQFPSIIYPILWILLVQNCVGRKKHKMSRCVQNAALLVLSLAANMHTRGFEGLELIASFSQYFVK